MKKRIIVTIVSALAMLGLLFLLNPFQVMTINICYDLTTESEGLAEFYYAPDSEHISPSRLYADNMKQGETRSIKKNIEKENYIFRIDPCNIEGEDVTISNLRVKYMWIEKAMDMSEYQLINDMDNANISEDEISATATGEDAYVVYSAKDKIAEVNKATRTVAYIVYCIAAVLTGLFVFAQYRRFKIVMYWAIDIVKNRNLIVQLAKNDFKSRFAASYLGGIWAFIQPIVTIIIYVFVFQYGLKAGAPVEGITYVLWLVSGIVPWFFFQDALLSATNSLIEYAYLVKKVVFKINILPIVKITSALFVHLFFIIITILLYIANGRSFDIYIIQIVYYSFCAMILAVGLSYITSSVVIFFRDLGQIVNIILQFGMWLTPIMWDVSIMGPTLRKLMKLNPVYYIVYGYRDAFYNQTWFFEKPDQTVYFWVVTGLIFLAGMFVFKKLEKHFADVL